MSFPVAHTLNLEGLWYFRTDRWVFDVFPCTLSFFFCQFALTIYCSFDYCYFFNSSVINNNKVTSGEPASVLTHNVLFLCIFSHLVFSAAVLWVKASSLHWVSGLVTKEHFLGKKLLKGALGSGLHCRVKWTGMCTNLFSLSPVLQLWPAGGRTWAGVWNCCFCHHCWWQPRCVDKPLCSALKEETPVLESCDVLLVMQATKKVAMISISIWIQKSKQGLSVKFGFNKFSDSSSMLF